MIAPQIRTRWEGYQSDGKGGTRDRLKLWNEDMLKSTAQLMKVATTVTMAIKHRVMTKGINASGGKFSQYNKTSKIAVPPWYPQPRKGRLARAHKARNPYAWYASRYDYQLSRKLPPFKNFFASGGMWKGLQAKAMAPGWIRVHFAGSSPRMKVTRAFLTKQKEKDDLGVKSPSLQKMQNRAKAKGSAKREGQDLLAFNNKEAKLYLDLMSEFVGSAVLEDLNAQRRGFKIKQLDVKLQKKKKSFDRQIKKIMAKAGQGTGTSDPQLS